MQPTSTRWKSAVRESHTVVVECDVLYNGIVVVANVAIVGGSVALDRTAAVRGRCTAQFAEPLRIPNTSLDVFQPAGYEIAIRRGIRYGDGTTELMPDLGLTSVSASDRSQTVIDARLEVDYAVAAGTNYGAAIQALILDGVPSTTFAYPTITATTPQLVFPAQGDRWKFAQSMATSIGYELFYDGLGQNSMRSEPALATAVPTLTIAEGDGGVLMSAVVDRNRQYAYNRVVVTSQNASNTAIYRGVATDDDPASPTYYFGPFGRKPRFFVSEFITSDAQALAAAHAILAANIGVTRGLNMSAVPNPALEPSDVVAVTRSRLGMSNEVHIIDSMTIDLSAAGGMTLVSRSQQEGS